MMNDIRIVISRLEGKCDCLEDENSKLREALKDVLTVAKNRIPTIPTFFECEAIYKAQEILAHGCASTQKEAE